MIEEFTVYKANNDISLSKSVVAKQKRKRFSFGRVWEKAVISGEAVDFDKLVAHAMKLQLGSKAELRQLDISALRNGVALKLSNNSLSLE